MTDERRETEELVEKVLTTIHSASLRAYCPTDAARAVVRLCMERAIETVDWGDMYGDNAVRAIKRLIPQEDKP